MAKYPSISQTKNGRILIAKSNATGKALVPIKVVTGDGQLTNQNIETMENIINPLLELPFASPGRFVKEGQFQLDFALSNEHLEHGFYAREIGVFAKLDGEDNSTAVMIAYTNGGNFVDYIPAKDTPINSKVFEVTIAVDNAANVVVQRSDAAYITAGEMERHNTDANAHGGLLQKVKTELATHNTDISSHPAITAMIAKILGATNWQENPVATLKDIKNLLGMGGIVAQRLEENGFVKFANGFTIQWGSKKNISIGDGYNYDVIFPTAYASICLGVFPVLKRNSVEGGNYTIYYTNESNTGCKLITDESKSSGTAQGFAYFSIGY